MDQQQLLQAIRLLGKQILKVFQEPAAKTPVQNTSALTQPEKMPLKKAVEDANPTATKVEVGTMVQQTVTFPDGSTATLTGDKTVKEADSKGVQEPAAKKFSSNTSALTQPEKRCRRRR